MGADQDRLPKLKSERRRVSRKNALMRHGARQSIGIPPLSLASPTTSLRVARLSVGMTRERRPGRESAQGARESLECRPSWQDARSP